MHTLESIRSDLASPETPRRLDAVEALSRAELGAVDREALRELVERALADDEAVVRDDACYAALDRGLVELAPRLQNLLANDPDATVRATSAEVLGEFGAGDAVNALFEALDDPDRAVRSFAANSLGLLSAPEARLLAALVRQTENSVRVNLLIAALRVGASHVLDGLLGEIAAAARQEDDGIRMLNALDDLAARPGAADLGIISERLGETLVRLRAEVAPLDRGQLDALVARLHEAVSGR